MATRAEFLERIRREVLRSPGLFEASTAERPAKPAEAALAVRRQLAERWPQALERFREEFERLAGVFHRVATVAEVPGVIAGVAREKGARDLVTWDPASLGFELRPTLGSDGFSVTAALTGQEGEAARLRHREDAARAQLGVTGADLALAETGTLILISGPGRPRSTSLLPDTHVAVFGKGSLVETLEQVGVVLEALHADPAWSRADFSRPGGMITFITGPSRTADIELTLTRGVHGPKEVHAVFVDGL